ncbi:helix-turn-helix domain-containing protein [Pseudanabaena sp. PCC 6802]|uniref:helix-turn-helix domain-containing protein n=1 Tax=Pseudanabaena sp. PCC 6802 TaxID=118173 RepID=UPI000347A3E7|nr:helix-turn-helix domain-containing protein [Pseudanabaena sp. PCC 6802]
MSSETSEVLQQVIKFEQQGRYLTPFQRKLLLKNLQSELRAEYRQRIEIMLLADMGQTQTQIAHVLGCSRGTVRLWSSMARNGQAHNWEDIPIGRPKAVSEPYIDRLKELVNHSPRDYGYAFQRWTALWLKKQLIKELGIEISDRHINRLLKEMGLSTRLKQLDKTSAIAANSKCSIKINDLHSSLSTDTVIPFNFHSTQ